jgi:hypothetical protein
VKRRPEPEPTIQTAYLKRVFWIKYDGRQYYVEFHLDEEGGDRATVMVQKRRGGRLYSDVPEHICDKLAAYARAQPVNLAERIALAR